MITTALLLANQELAVLSRRGFGKSSERHPANSSSAEDNNLHIIMKLIPYLFVPDPSCIEAVDFCRDFVRISFLCPLFDPN
jgi:hypothetical protein